jgi:7,8-dihydro-6-hydroxymethylpterin dimethyltransferase
MDQTDSLIRKTLSLCPQCGSDAITAIKQGGSFDVLRTHPGILDAKIIESDGKVFMRKRCRYHGEFDDLLASDAPFYHRMESLAAAPDAEYRPDEPLHDHGVMSVRYGTGAFIIFDLTNRCNMRCEPCYMDANAGQDVQELTELEIRSILDRAAAVHDRREVNFLFAGGEPTLSPHFLEALGHARSLGFKRLYVATNGIRFAQEPDFAVSSKAAGLHGVFLQLDGTTDEANAHRGIRNFMEVKIAALNHIVAAGLQVTLQTAVVNGLNTAQIGPLVQFAVEQGLFGIIFQPIMFAGRDRSLTPAVRRARRYTLSHLAHDLADQTPWDWRPLRDWFPMSAFSVFGHLSDRLRGENKSMICTAAPINAIGSPLAMNVRTGAVTPIGGFFDVEGFLADMRRMIDENLTGFALISALHAAMHSRFDSSAAPTGFTVANLYQLHEQCAARVNSSIEGWTDRTYEVGEWRIFVVVGMWFQDLFNFDLRSIQTSTTVVATAEGEISFCAYNSAGWREAVERLHRTAALAEWNRLQGRHEIFAGGKLVPITVPVAR